MYPLEGQAQPAILIHSPRTGRDVRVFKALRGLLISISSPRTGRDGAAGWGSSRAGGFQSTLPAREETRYGCGRIGRKAISIHSSHTGRDTARKAPIITRRLFQSTLPIREETTSWRLLPTTAWVSIHSSHTGRDMRKVCAVCRRPGISIHSFHTGRDSAISRRSWPTWHFNPLFPYGKRRTGAQRYSRAGNFNPLFPYGKRRRRNIPARHGRGFQSTLPIREETGSGGQRAGDEIYFNPLFPYGKRLTALLLCCPARLPPARPWENPRPHPLPPDWWPRPGRFFHPPAAF